MKHWIPLALLGLTLVACSISPQNQQAVHDALYPLVQSGALTQEQFDAIMAAISGSGNWWQWPVAVIGSIIGTALGINSKIPFIGRGPKTQKVGLPQSKVHPE